jgi:NADH:ubiquinone oxidoreductase subunit F (NADH-binding)
MSEIIKKIEEYNLLGRSGSRFPVANKIKAVLESNEDEKYLICNASEGEMETYKDYFILKNHADVVLDGILIVASLIGTKKNFINLKKEYFEEISPLLKSEKIEIVEKRGGYIGGEETAMIEAIEGNRPEPRIKPPFPTQEGLWGKPTLVNNVETFYCISKINSDDYEGNRFYSISGTAKNKGVFELREGMTVKEILEKTDNVPDFDYFLQVGGGTSGKIILPNEIDTKLECLGSIIIYNREEVDVFFLLESWVNVLLEGNCDKCTPCREGLFRIKEMIDKKDFSVIDDIFYVMDKTSLCPLGKVAVLPFQTLIKKIINNENGSKN